MWATRRVVQAAVGNCAAVIHGRGISTAVSQSQRFCDIANFHLCDCGLSRPAVLSTLEPALWQGGLAGSRHSWGHAHTTPGSGSLDGGVWLDPVPVALMIAHIGGALGPHASSARMAK